MINSPEVEVFMNIVYRVELTADEFERLTAVVASKVGAQKRKRAQILLAAAKGIDDATIARTLPCGPSTIYRTKKRFVIEGLAASLEERPGRGASRKLTKQEEAKLVALAFPIAPRSNARSRRGSIGEMPRAPASSGCSTPPPHVGSLRSSTRHPQPRSRRRPHDPVDSSVSRY
jgi:hypothetical protein